jgi:hypothetical protein
MKLLKYIGSIALATLFAAACNKNETPEITIPAISNVTITPSTGLVYGDSITVAATVNDPVTSLSTLEVKVIVSDVEVFSKSLRTKGNTATVSTKFELPFAANAENNGEVLIKLESINVDGGSVSQTQTLHAARPALGSTLYLFTSSGTIALKRDNSNTNLYISDAGSYANEIKGKIGNASTISASSIVWVSSGNKIVKGTADGSDITLSDPSYSVEKVSFNAMTFELAFIGTKLPSVKFNSTTLIIGDDGRFHGEVQFTKGEEVTVEGIANLATAYNPDFFNYSDGKLYFKAATGTYQIVYWAGTVNYMWLRQDGAVYPDGIWFTGAGMGLPTFVNDITNIWWGWDDWSTTSRQSYYYCPKIGEGKYQLTVYFMNTAGSWWLQAEFKLFKEKAWDTEFNPADFGFVTNQFDPVSGGNFVHTENLTEGLYRVTIDMSGGPGNYFLIAQKIR